MNNLGEKKVILAVLSIAVLMTAGGLFLTYRSYEKAEEGKRKIAGVRKSIAEARDKKRRVPSLERDVIILRSNVEEYVKILPEDKHIHNFINTINRFEQESGITMTKLDAPGRGRKKKKGASANAFDRIVYKIKISGTYKNLLRFVNRFENYERFVAIEDFTFKPEKKSGVDSNEIVLSGSLRLETYVYNPTGPTKNPVKIDKIDQKREALREQIIAQRNAIEVLRYRLDPVLIDARRDIFGDPRRRIEQETDADKPAGAEKFAKQKRFVAWAKTELKEIQDMLLAEENEPLIIRQMEIKKQIDERVSSLNTQIVNARNDRLIQTGPLTRDLDRNVVGPLAQIIKDRKISVKTGLAVQDLEVILTKMEHFFKKGELGQVTAQFDLVAKQLGTTDTEDPEAKDLVVRIYSLKNKAMVISEFSKRPIKISGIISVKGSPVAIINGRVFERDQMLDNDVKITDIRPEEVEFRFRDVRIIRRWE